MLKQCDDLVKGQFVEMFGDERKHKRIDELCEFFGDGDWIESKDQSEKGIRLIQTGNIGCNEFIEKGSRARYISKETFINLSCTKVLPGDILISRLPDPIGRACIIPDIGESITAVDCAIIRLEKEVLPEYFVNYTLTTDYQSQIESFVTGSTRKRISRANLGGIVIPVPRIDKQKQFVEIYKHLDKSKVALKDTIKSLNKIYTSIVNTNLG